MSVSPSGCVCQSLRAQGSNVTYAAPARAGAGAWNSGSMRTVPVKCSAGAFCDGCAPLLLISMFVAAPFVRSLHVASAAYLVERERGRQAAECFDLLLKRGD